MLQSPENKEIMVNHMDFHFRQNRRLREKKRVVSREWFVGDDDWINERAQENKSIKYLIFTHYVVLPFQTDVGVIEEVEVAIPSIVFKEDDASACGVCGEAFEKYWDEDKEDWMLRNAIKFENVLFENLSFMHLGSFAFYLPNKHG